VSGVRASRGSLSAVADNCKRNNEYGVLSRHTQNQRSVFARRTRRDRMHCSSASWCRKAKSSSWSAARERAAVGRVRRNERNTKIMVEKPIQRCPQPQVLQQERTFQQAHRSVRAAVSAVPASNSIWLSIKSAA
jgi:hypothetical protein